MWAYANLNVLTSFSKPDKLIASGGCNLGARLLNCDESVARSHK